MICYAFTKDYLSVLMQWAEGGSLDDFIDARLGRRAPSHVPLNTDGNAVESVGPEIREAPTASPPLSRTARIRAFRELQRAPASERERLRREMLFGDGLEGSHGIRRTAADWKAVHLLSAEEIRGLFGDIVAGLAFLVRPRKTRLGTCS